MISRCSYTAATAALRWKQRRLHTWRRRGLCTWKRRRSERWRCTRRCNVTGRTACLIAFSTCQWTVQLHFRVVVTAPPCILSFRPFARSTAYCSNSKSFIVVKAMTIVACHGTVTLHFLNTAFEPLRLHLGPITVFLVDYPYNAVNVEPCCDVFAPWVH